MSAGRKDLSRCDLREPSGHSQRGWVGGSDSVSRRPTSRPMRRPRPVRGGDGRRSRTGLCLAGAQSNARAGCGETCLSGSEGRGRWQQRLLTRPSATEAAHGLLIVPQPEGRSTPTGVGRR
jgi:hypothetical protein